MRHGATPANKYTVRVRNPMANPSANLGQTDQRKAYLSFRRLRRPIGWIDPPKGKGEGKVRQTLVAFGLTPLSAGTLIV